MARGDSGLVHVPGRPQAVGAWCFTADVTVTACFCTNRCRPQARRAWSQVMPNNKARPPATAGGLALLWTKLFDGDEDLVGDHARPDGENTLASCGCWYLNGDIACCSAPLVKGARSVDMLGCNGTVIESIDGFSIGGDVVDRDKSRHLPICLIAEISCRVIHQDVLGAGDRGFVELVSRDNCIRSSKPDRVNHYPPIL